MSITKNSRIIAVLMAVLVLFASLPSTSVMASEINPRENTTEFAGGTGTAADPYRISTKYHLDNVRRYLSANFVLINDIVFTEEDFSEDGEYYNYGSCWEPIGDSGSKFTGTFDGNHFEIKNLQIHQKNSNYIGLFGYVYNGSVLNLRMVGVNIEGKDYVGSVCGYLHSASVANSSNVKKASISSCYVSGSVTGYGAYTGGICGYMNGSAYSQSAPGGGTYRYSDAAIINSINEARVCGTNYAGGIVSYASSYGSAIDSCINSGAVTATEVAGGILGYTNGAKSSSYSIVGFQDTLYMRYYFDYAKLSNCINKGDITAGKCGGIIGDGYYTTVGSSGTSNGAKNSYNIGTLSGDTVGGIIPCKFTGDIDDCFYLDTSASQYATSYGKQVSADELKKIDTFSNWDFSTVWTMAGDWNYKYPELQCFTLSGKVSLDEKIGYLDTVTPNISAIKNAGSDLSYDWYIDNGLVHTGQTYVVTGSDIGKTIKVKVTSSHPMSLGSIESNGILITKAQQVAIPEVPTLLSKSDADFEITTVITQEYSIDNVTWQSNGKFEDLDPNKEYTVYSRVLENDLYLLGEGKEVLKVTTDRRTISGQVSVSGTPQYGQTLIADISGVLPAEATLTYEWRASGSVIGTASTYTVAEQDIGKGIILVIKGTDDYCGSLSAPVVSVTKATAQDPGAPIVLEITNDSVKLLEKSGYEYSTDKVHWQSSALFEGLDAAKVYTFYQRIKETDTTFASKTSDGTSVTTLKNTVAVPGNPVVESVTNTSVTLVAMAGYEYSMDGVTWQTSNVFTGFAPNTEYAFCQRIAENDTDYASDPSGYTLITTLKNTASAPAAPTVEEITDHSVTLTAIEGCEYSMDGAIWQFSNVFSGLSCGTEYTFYQRYMETSTSYAGKSSEALVVKTEKGTQSKPSAPTLSGKTHDSVTVNVESGYEYSRDGVHWQTDNVFTGLDADTDYLFYQRKAETEMYYASESSAALTVRTEEAPQDILGDVNDDGKVNMGDVAMIFAHVSGTSILTNDTGLDRCDINGDGKVNMGDVARLYAHVKGSNKLY